MQRKIRGTIDTMTHTQWAEMAHFREAWYARGSATGPSDRVATEAAIAGLYALAGYPPPRLLFVQSPLSALVVLGIAQLRGQLSDQLSDQLWDQLRGQLGDQLGDQLRGQLGDQLGDQLRDQLRDQLWDQLGDQLGDQLRDQLRDQLWDQLRDQLRDQLWDQLWDQLRDQLRDQLWDQLRDQLRGQLSDQLSDQLWDQLSDQLSDQLWDQLWRCFYGQHEAYWIALYIWAQHIGVQFTAVCTEALTLWRQLTANGWWWPYQHLCVVADRPSLFHVDAQRRLHAETGPAMAFQDGFALWAWHGVRVSQQVIEQPTALTLKAIQDETNTERRRVMIERWGWDRYLEATQARLLDVDTEPAGVPGLRGLYACQDAHGVEMHVLICCCASTGRTYSLEVPPEVRTCQHAAQWLAHTDHLELLVRT